VCRGGGSQEAVPKTEEESCDGQEVRQLRQARELHFLLGGYLPGSNSPHEAGTQKRAVVDLLVAQTVVVGREGFLVRREPSPLGTRLAPPKELLVKCTESKRAVLLAPPKGRASYRLLGALDVEMLHAGDEAVHQVHQPLPQDTRLDDHVLRSVHERGDVCPPPRRTSIPFLPEGVYVGGFESDEEELEMKIEVQVGGGLEQGRPVQRDVGHPCLGATSCCDQVPPLPVAGRAAGPA
jgi:hypothetical protein